MELVPGRPLVLQDADGREMITMWDARPEGGWLGRLAGYAERWQVRSASSVASLLAIDDSDLFKAEARPLGACKSCRMASSETPEGRRHHVVVAGIRATQKGKADSCGWIIFDAVGRILHKVALPIGEHGGPTMVDGEGRLWICGRLGKKKWAVVRVVANPPSATIVGTSKRARTFEDFDIPAFGPPSLPRGATPGPDETTIDVVVYRTTSPAWAHFALPVLALVMLAALVHAVGRLGLLRSVAAMGEPFRNTGAGGGVTAYPVEALASLERGVIVEIVVTALIAVGLLWLWRLARLTPARAAGLAAVWVLGSGMLGALACTVVTLRPTGALDIANISAAPVSVGIALVVALAAVASTARP